MQSEKIMDAEGNLLAIVTQLEGHRAGVNFVTPDDLQQQVAVMNRAAGEAIVAHEHLPVPRSLRGTQEVLIVIKGSLEAKIYDLNRVMVESRELGPGTIITLVSGGHGFAVLSDCLFVEVKQGPYVAGKDKVIFPDG